MSRHLSATLRAASANHPTTAAPAKGADPVRTSASRRRWLEVLPAVAGLVLFLAALEVLRIELRTVSWADLMTDVMRVHGADLALAIALTVLSYVVLTGYDLVAFVYIGKTLSRARVMVTSFLAYAIANNVSFAMLSGASVRYRYYSRWGVTGEELSRIVFWSSVTFWLGFVRARRAQPRDDATSHVRPVAGRPRDCGRLAAHAHPARIPGGNRPPTDSDSTLGARTHVARATRCRGTARAVSYRLGSGQCGSVCAPAAKRPVVSPLYGCLSRFDSAGHGEPCTGRSRRVRRVDGAAPQAVPGLEPAPAGAGGLSSGVLPVAFDRGFVGSRCRRAPSAAQTRGTRRRGPRTHVGPAHSTRARSIHVSGWRRLALLRRDARGGRTPDRPRPRVAARNH